MHRPNTSSPNESQLENMIEMYLQQFEADPDVTVTVHVDGPKITIRKVKAVQIAETSIS